MCAGKKKCCREKVKVRSCDENSMKHLENMSNNIKITPSKFEANIING